MADFSPTALAQLATPQLTMPQRPGLASVRGATPGSATPVSGAPNSASESTLRGQATRFEAAFLAEMLRHAGLAKMPESFHGGPGEAAFTGTLVQEYANLIAASGRTGIADQVLVALRERAAAAGPEVGILPENTAAAGDQSPTGTEARGR